MKIEKIQQRVCETFGVTLVEIKGNARESRIADARHASMALAEKFSGDHHEAIAAAHGRTMASSVSHSMQRSKELREIDLFFKQKWDEAEQSIRAKI